MPRMNERDRRAGVEEQLTTLLDQAAERPGPEDGLGIVNLFRAMAFSEIWEKNEASKAAYDTAMADLVAVLQRRIGALREAENSLSILEVARQERAAAERAKAFWQGLRPTP